ncbi:hypothetical protein CHELA41_50761 [Hyphomicrobiales bacterium]|nr:hypothetical protein CHELA41_50761 [Hyphomicrobiales bacterium]
MAGDDRRIGLAGDGGHIDDPAAPGLAHGRAERTNGVEGTGQIDRDDAAPFGRIHLPNLVRDAIVLGRYAGIVDDGVERPADHAGGLRQPAVHGGIIGDVEDERHGLAARRLDRRDGVIDVGPRHVGDADDRAAAGETDGDRLPDAAAGAGDEDAAALMARPDRYFIRIDFTCCHGSFQDFRVFRDCAVVSVFRCGTG